MYLSELTVTLVGLESDVLCHIFFLKNNLLR